MTCRVKAIGVVQGVGFRPYTARLAKRLDLCGSVRNSGGIVEILLQGTKEQITQFLEQMETNPPEGANILRLEMEQVPEQSFAEEFTILPSGGTPQETPILPPDLPTCSQCLAELHASDNRRYRHPFISCTACGPRYSIIEDIPYDRETTTMHDFALCDDCAEEYRADTRRRHAQTICCHKCGPQLLFQKDSAEWEGECALNHAVKQIERGGVIAVKGIGGYQFVCRPDDRRVVAQLRQMKKRERKPLAVMFPTLESICRFCHVNVQEKQLLQSPARPIVLLEKRTVCFCREIAGDSHLIGAFLPYSPLHHLLTEQCGPLVVTSGNVSGEPLTTQDTQMMQQFLPKLDGVLYHKRRIQVPLDDSVAQVLCGGQQIIRRSRGYVPLPILTKQTFPVPILAAGGDLKACFCLATGQRAYLSQYLGDMENRKASDLYNRERDRMQKLLNIQPSAVVCDMHPAYHSTRRAKEVAKAQEIPFLQVQHHHAHTASVMAEHGLSSCIGVCFDGTGYGPDGSVWGGEFLYCKEEKMQRMGCLEPTLLCGGDKVAKDAQLCALCHLYDAGLPSDAELFPLVRAAIDNQINTRPSSSAGRLFDAVSFLLGLGCENTYEGECAAALEHAAFCALETGKRDGKRFLFSVVQQEGLWRIQRKPYIHYLMQQIADGIDKDWLALEFHLALAEAIVAVCCRIRQESGENQIALSGGVFTNRILAEQCVSLLENQGFVVYLNRSVPPGDGGICLGQAWLAAKILERQSQR